MGNDNTLEPVSVIEVIKNKLDTYEDEYCISREEGNYLLSHIEKLQKGYAQMIEMYQFEAKGRESDSDEVETELRKLLETYWQRRNKLHNERQEAKESGDIEAEMAGELLEKLCLKMVAELYQSMKVLGALSEEEMGLGLVLRAGNDK